MAPAAPVRSPHSPQMLNRLAQDSAPAKVRQPRGIPPAREGLSGRGGASRGRPRVPAAPPRVPPLPPPSPGAPLGPPLPPTCGHRAGAGQRSGSPLHTHKSTRAPGRAPRLPPPQRSPIRPAGRRILRSGRPAAAAAPAPPETKARRVARSVPSAFVARRSDSKASLLRGAGGAGGAATAGRGRGRSQHPRLAPPRDPSTSSAPPAHFLPRDSPRKLQRAEAAAQVPGPPSFSKGPWTSGEPSPAASDLTCGMMGILVPAPLQYAAGPPGRSSPGHHAALLTLLSGFFLAVTVSQTHWAAVVPQSHSRRQTVLSGVPEPGLQSRDLQDFCGVGSDRHTVMTGQARRCSPAETLTSGTQLPAPLPPDSDIV
ncbi:uncharacterized protein [Castor canadensis]|uniref:Uncharacterized protein n=1 Tax=Castor canadensis TaxID=51338 RepID=A0AC58KV21_CASCN